MESTRAQPKVWIVVLTWNRAEAVISCLISLRALIYGNLEVLVVDNHSTDDTVERLASIFPGEKIIVNDRNMGYTGGNNVGLRYALSQGADYVLLLNNDCTVHPRLVDELVGVAEQDPGIAVVGCKNLHHDDRRVVWAAWERVDYGPLLTRIYGRWQWDRPAFSRQRDVESVVGCGYLWRAAALEDVGPLDTEFFGYHEDVDWCYRARQKGWRVVYAGAAELYHRGGLSSEPKYENHMPVMYFLGRNGVLFARKHGSAWDLSRLAFNSVLGSLRRWLRARQRGVASREPEFWQGFWDGLRRRNRHVEFRVGDESSNVWTLIG